MTKESGIAVRRHHRERLKKNRRFHFGRDLIDEKKQLGMAINTPTPCSCWMCRNSREAEGKTLQEKRFDEETDAN